MRDCYWGIGGKYDEMVCDACEKSEAKVDLINVTCDNQTVEKVMDWE